MLAESFATSVARIRREQCAHPSMERNALCVTRAAERMREEHDMTKEEVELALAAHRAAGGVVEGDLPRVVAAVHELRRRYVATPIRAALDLQIAAERDARGEGPYDLALAKKRADRAEPVEPRTAASDAADEVPQPYSIALARKRAKEGR
jgi:hypothetical protein